MKILNVRNVIRVRAGLLPVAIFLNLTSGCLRAGPLDDWTWRNPLPSGNALLGITYGNNQFVAVGKKGSILTSPDGLTWTRRDSGTSDQLRSVAFGNGLFVAAGAEDYGRGGHIPYGVMLISRDGINWTNLEHTVDELCAVSYGKGCFMAAGSDLIHFSLDGIMWANCSPETGYGLSGIACGKDQFVAVGSKYYYWADRTKNGAILTSRDGLEWTCVHQGTANQYGYLCGIAYGDSLFVAVGVASGKGPILTSTDGIAWADHSLAAEYHFQDVAFGDGQFVTVGEAGFVMTSSDGTNWTRQTSGTSSLLNAVGHGTHLFVAVGEGGTIVTSPDGITWTRRVSGSDAYWSNVANDKSLFVAVGGKIETRPGLGIVMTSTDGAAWNNPITVADNCLRGITYGNNQFVAVGDGGTIVTSPDASVWTRRPFNNTNDLSAIVYGNNRFVAVGGMWEDPPAGAIITSLDGINWINCAPGLNAPLSDVAYGDHLFMAVGASLIATSSDGVVWTSRSFEPYGWFGFNCVAFGNHQFVAAGPADGFCGCIAITADAVEWTLMTPFYGTYPVPDGLIFHRMAYANNQFIGAGWIGYATSPDGYTWTRHAFAADSLNGVAYGNSHYVAVGENGAILQSGVVSPKPKLGLKVLPDSGMMQVILDGWAGQRYSLQISSDLRNWTTIARLNLTNDVYHVDTGGWPLGSLFYRAVLR